MIQKILAFVGLRPAANTSTVSGVSAPKVSPQKQAPALGGYCKMDLSAA